MFAALSGLGVGLLVILLACDPEALLHIHLAVAFAISTTLFAPIDRAQVLLQVRVMYSLFVSWHAVNSIVIQWAFAPQCSPHLDVYMCL